MLMPPKTIFITSRILGFCWARATTFANKRYLSCWKRVINSYITHQSTFFFCSVSGPCYGTRSKEEGMAMEVPGLVLTRLLTASGRADTPVPTAYTRQGANSSSISVQHMKIPYDSNHCYCLILSLSILVFHLTCRMMNSAFMSLSTLVITWTWNSNRKRTGSCFTGRNCGSIANLWVATRVSNPGISL